MLETLSNGERLAWAAGVVDADGTIGFYSQYSHKRCPKNKHVRVVSADEETLGELATILREVVGIDAKVSIVNHIRTVRCPNFYYTVSVQVHEDICKLLSALIPYLVGKKAQAELLLKLLRNHKKHAIYTEEEFAVIEALKLLKQNYKKKAEPSSVCLQSGGQR